MRYALALGLLIMLCASATAGTAHHYRTRHHVLIQPSPGVCVPPSCYKFPGYPPLPPRRSGLMIRPPSEAVELTHRILAMGHQRKMPGAAIYCALFLVS